MDSSDVVKELNEIKRLTMLQVKEFLSVSDVALLLNRTEGTIRKMAQNHQLGYTRPFGKEIYFRKEEINRIMEKGYIPSITELVEKA